MTAAKLPTARFCQERRETFKPKRAWQSFCSSKCRVKNYVDLQVAQSARDAKARQELEAENQALRKRIQELEAQVAKLT